MIEKRNAPTSAATLAEAAGAMATISNRHLTPPRHKSQDGISERLGVGPKSGKGLRQLSAEMGLDQREVRRQIARERKAGLLILSDNKNGYFLPSSEHEIRNFIRSMSHRSKEIAEIRRAAEDVLAEMSGQGMVEGW